MEQIVDLQNDADFQSLGVAVVSIALDPLAEQASGAQEYGITQVPLLIDGDKSVSAAYDVLKWAVGSGEPGHTFVLVDKDGRIAWVKDYGAPDNPNRTMYVQVSELYQQVKAHLE